MGIRENPCRLQGRSRVALARGAGLPSMRRRSAPHGPGENALLRGGVPDVRDHAPPCGARLGAEVPPLPEIRCLPGVCWSQTRARDRLCFPAAMSRQSTPTADRSSDCRIRLREIADLDECVHVLAKVHEADGYPVNWPDDPRTWLMRPSLLAAWVAERGEHVVGHIALSRGGAGDVAPALWSRRARVPVEETAVVSRLFVSPAARGHGIGALLMARAVQEAKARAVHPVLDVLASDTSAAALYERLGWSLLATVDQRWGPAQTVTVHCYAAPGLADPQHPDRLQRGTDHLLSCRLPTTR
jgi:GNAT superfamily N-acetyltransferase